MIKDQNHIKVVITLKILSNRNQLLPHSTLIARKLRLQERAHSLTMCIPTLMPPKWMTHNLIHKTSKLHNLDQPSIRKPLPLEFRVQMMKAGRMTRKTKKLRQLSHLNQTTLSQVILSLRH